MSGTTKKLIRVIVEKEFEIEIPNSFLTQEELESFSQMMYEVRSPLELFEHAATQLVSRGDCFVEGLGRFVEGEGELTDHSRGRFCELWDSVEVEDVTLDGMS